MSIRGDLLLDYSRSLVCCFDSRVALFVRMRNDMVLLHNRDNNYSVLEHDFGSPWRWDVNRGNSYFMAANHSEIRMF